MKLQHILSSFLVLGSIITSTVTEANFMKSGLDSKNTELRKKVLSFECVCKEMLQCESVLLLQPVLSSLNEITRFSQLNLQQNSDDCITFSTIKNAIQWAHIEFTKKLQELKKTRDACETDVSKNAKIEGDIGVFQKIVSCLTYYIAKQDAIEKSPTRPDFENKLSMEQIANFNLVYDEMLNEDDSAKLKKELQLSIKTIIKRFESSINTYNSKWDGNSTLDFNSKDIESFLTFKNEIGLAEKMFYWKSGELKKSKNPETGEFENPEFIRKVDFFEAIACDLKSIYLRFLLLEKFYNFKVFEEN